MAQKRNMTTFTSLLVSDRKDPVSHASNPRPSESIDVVAEIQSDKGALLVSRLTGDALKALKDTKQAVNGMIAYNLTDKNFVLYQEDDWMLVTKAGLKELYLEGPESSEEGDMMAFAGDLEKPFKARSTSRFLKENLDSDPDPVPVHYVKGPVSSKPGNLAVFNNSTGSEVADSGLNVQKVLFRHPNQDRLAAQDVIQLRNLGELQFVNGLGVVLVDDLIPVTYMTRGTGADAQVCTVFGGDFAGESSSPSALVEINSTIGALLVSRMTTEQRLALADPQNGMIVYDTELKSFMFYQKGEWTPLSSGGGSQGDVTGPDVSVKGEIPLFNTITGKEIAQSGVIIDASQKMTGLKNIRISTPKPYNKNYSLWADSGVVAWDYFTTSSGQFKTVLGRDEEIHEEVESLWNALSFVQYTHHHDEQKHKRFGLIAEEVAEVMPHWVQDHEEGRVLNKSALLDSAYVMIQKLLKENKNLQKTMTQQDRKIAYQARKLDDFIKAFNLRSQKNGFSPIKFEEAPHE